MASYPSTLGAISPGVIIQHTAGGFGSVLATGAGQALVSTGANAYSFSTYGGASSNSGVVQLISIPPAVTDFSPFIAFLAPTTPYNIAAEVAVINVTPVSASSTFITNFSVTCC